MADITSFPLSERIDDRRGDEPMDVIEQVKLRMKAAQQPYNGVISSIPEPRGNYRPLSRQAGIGDLDAIERRAAGDFLAQPLPEAKGPSPAEMRADPNAPPETIVRPAGGIADALQRADAYLKRGIISQAQYDRLMSQIGGLKAAYESALEVEPAGAQPVKPIPWGR